MNFVLLAESTTGDEVNQIVQAIDGKQWLLLAALLITIVIRRLRDAEWWKYESKRIPSVAFMIGILATATARISEALLQEKEWRYALLQGLMEGALVGFTSMGWYSLVFRKEKKDDTGRKVPSVD